MKRFFAGFRYAASGLCRCIRWERNFRFHLVAAGLALFLGWAYGLGRGQTAVLWLAIGLVLALEALNTAVEAAVDLCCPGRNPLAKAAKDAAAAAVLLAALASVGVGVCLFWEEAGFRRLVSLLGDCPLLGAAAGAYLILGAAWVAKTPAKPGTTEDGEEPS